MKNTISKNINQTAENEICKAEYRQALNIPSTQRLSGDENIDCFWGTYHTIIKPLMEANNKIIDKYDLPFFYHECQVKIYLGNPESGFSVLPIFQDEFYNATLKEEDTQLVNSEALCLNELDKNTSYYNPYFTDSKDNHINAFSLFDDQTANHIPRFSLSPILVHNCKLSIDYWNQSQKLTFQYGDHLYYEINFYSSNTPLNDIEDGTHIKELRDYSLSFWHSQVVPCPINLYELNFEIEPCFWYEQEAEEL